MTGKDIIPWQDEEFIGDKIDSNMIPSLGFKDKALIVLDEVPVWPRVGMMVEGVGIVTAILKRSRIWNRVLQGVKINGEKFFLDIDTLEPIKIPWTEYFISYVYDPETIWDHLVQMVSTHTDEDKYLHAGTFEILTVAWTNDEITQVADVHAIGKRTVQNVMINDSEWIYIDPLTLQKIELQVSWTDDKITVFWGTYTIWNHTIHIVKINADRWIMVDSTTLEKVELHVTWTNDEITGIWKMFTIWNHQLQEVKINHSKSIYIDPRTKEAIKINDDYLVSVRMVTEGEYIFTTENWTTYKNKS